LSQNSKLLNNQTNVSDYLHDNLNNSLLRVQFSKPLSAPKMFCVQCVCP